MNVRDQPEIDEIKENEVLAALPSDDFARLLPRLERVVLPPFEICTILTMRLLTFVFQTEYRGLHTLQDR